jgi:hypothetical protein
VLDVLLKHCDDPEHFQGRKRNGMTLIVEQDYRLYLQVARQELHFQRQLLIVVMEAARRTMTLRSVVDSVKGMQSLGMTCALLRQYHQKVVEEEHRVCHDAHTPLNFDPDRHHWLPNDVALPLGEQTMPGKIVLSPHIYTNHAHAGWAPNGSAGLVGQSGRANQ